ncbi:hypothetical protein BJX76DRAFT_355121 [Aspergillus varians]
MGPYEDELNDQHRVELIARIAAHLPHDETVEPGFWAFVWLSDLKQLEVFTGRFDDAFDPATRRALYENPMWTRALKTWATRDRGSKGKSVVVDDIKKRKSPSGTEPQPTKISRRSESVEKVAQHAGDIAPVPRRRSRSQSPSKIPRPALSHLVAATPATPPTSTPRRAQSPDLRGRSVAMADKCRQRDKDACLITKGGECAEVAHIYPYSLGTKLGKKGHRDFWQTLSTFWSAKQIDQWESSVLGPERTEILQNLMSLAPTVHALWGKARFALKPLQLSSDSKTLTVEFHWLYYSTYAFKHLQTPPSLPCNLDSTDRGTRLFDCETKRCIKTGDVLTFTTDDPETMPLPSVELLRMQWLLNRLVSLSGAADVSDEEFGPDDPMALAPPISVESEDEVSLGEEEEEEEEEEGEDNEEAPAASSAAAVPRVGENCPLIRAEGKRGAAISGQNPLALRRRNPNVH